MPETRKPFERKWSDEQRAAIAHAMLDANPKLSAKRAVQAAVRGELPGAGAQLEPFGPMPISTAHDIARNERLGREVKARGRLAKASSSETAFRVVLASAWDDLDKAREAARRKQLNPSQRMKAVREAVATAKAIHEAERSLGGATPEPNQQPSTEPPKRNTEADAITRAARKRAGTEHHEATTHQGNGYASGNDTHDEPTSSEQDSVAVARNATHLSDVASSSN